MSVFSKFKEYGGSWNVTDTEKISKAEVAEIKSAEVVTKEQKWGTSISICFLMKNGRKRFGALSKMSDLEVGDKVDPKSITFLTLSKDGEKDIYRVDGELLESSDNEDDEEEEEEVKPVRKARKK